MTINIDICYCYWQHLLHCVAIKANVNYLYVCICFIYVKLDFFA